MGDRGGDRGDGPFSRCASATGAIPGRVGTSVAPGGSGGVIAWVAVVRSGFFLESLGRSVSRADSSGASDSLGFVGSARIAGAASVGTARADGMAWTAVVSCGLAAGGASSTISAVLVVSSRKLGGGSLARASNVCLLEPAPPLTAALWRTSPPKPAGCRTDRSRLQPFRSSSGQRFRRADRAKAHSDRRPIPRDE